MAKRRDTSVPPDPWTGDSLDRVAYRLSIWALIPVAGLVLGPLALILAIAAWRRRNEEGTEIVRGSLLVASILGALLTISNAVGITLIVLGLRGD